MKVELDIQNLHCTLVILDDSNKFSILKKGIGIERKLKQVRDHEQVKDKAQGFLYVERKLIQRHFLSLFRLKLVYNG